MFLFLGRGPATYSSSVESSKANPGDGEQQPWRGDGGGREEGDGVQQHHQNTSCTASTKDRESLHTQLQRELKKTGKLKTMYLNLQNQQEKDRKSVV